VRKTGNEDRAPEAFHELLATPEGGRVEFKSATGGFHFEELVKYCVAIANEGGGKVVLGVTDKRPRRVVGTRAFSEPGRTEAGLFEALRQRIPVEEIVHEGHRVLIIHVPGRLPGTAWQYKGSFWMRAGDALVAMTDDQLRRIHDETGPDFSAEICPRATLDDLDSEAIEAFRMRWHRKVQVESLLQSPGDQLLRDAELVTEAGVTYAALILLGTRAALGRHLAQAEVIFEYRSSEAPGPANQREEFREGVLHYYDRLWELVNLRNDLQHYQDGLFMLNVSTFDERAVREAVLNAVSHRDYRHGGSVFVRQYARRIEIVSPGGLPPGITPENILWQQNPRNRRIAEALARCGLVERAGQGFDLIYGECIRNSKPLPDFARTDAHFVWLTLHGEIQDPEFLRFLEKVGHETQASFDTRELLILDFVHREIEVPAELHPRLSRLIDLGVLERVGSGRGSRLLLSRRFYRHLGKAGVYTRRRGLDRETNKALLLKHIEDAGESGAPFQELSLVVPAVPRSTIQRLLRELRDEGRIRVRGQRRAARWIPSPGTGDPKQK